MKLEKREQVRRRGGGECSFPGAEQNRPILPWPLQKVWAIAGEEEEEEEEGRELFIWTCEENTTITCHDVVMAISSTWLYLARKIRYYQVSTVRRNPLGAGRTGA
jgi:hypothetical protein